MTTEVGRSMTQIRASVLEETNSIDPISREYWHGDGFRYMTKAQIIDVLNGTKTLDVTQAVNNAIQSGHSPFLNAGNPGIADTIIIDGDKNLDLFNAVTLERIGSSTEPMIHMYGNACSIRGSGQSRVKNNLVDSDHGLVLVGPHPNDVGGVSDVPTRGFTIQGLKVMGAVTTVETGKPGIYLHSGARRLGGNTSVCYKGVILNCEIQNCPRGIEFSTDANSHYINGLYITRWLEAAIWFNGSYGNVVDGVMMEHAEIALVPSNDKRYAIEFNKQNSGTETDTDAGYFADGALDNSVRGYAEVTNGTGINVGRNIALLRQNEDGVLQGNNDVHIVGVLSGGIGLLGNSTAETDVGTTNNIETVAGYIFNRGRWRVHGHNIKKLVDGSGTIRFKDSTAHLDDFDDEILLTATQGDIFSWDNIEDAGRMTARLELEYSCRVDGNLITQSGKVVWVTRLSSNTVYDYTKEMERRTPLPKGSAKILTPNITLSAGTDNNTMKVTVGFLTAGVGTKWKVGWSGKLLVGTLTKVDWDDDIKILHP